MGASGLRPAGHKTYKTYSAYPAYFPWAKKLLTGVLSDGCTVILTATVSSSPYGY